MELRDDAGSVPPVAEPPASQPGQGTALPARQTWRRRSETSLRLPATLLVIGVAGYLVMLLAMPGLSGLDVSAAAAVRSLPSALTTAPAQAATWLGTYLTVLVIGLVLATGLALWTRRLIEPAALAVSGPLTVRIVEALKHVTDRERPPTALAPAEIALDSSFPSGHTANGTVLLLLAALTAYGFLQAGLVRRLLLTVAVVLAVAVGASRVYLGYHWPSDVLGGWMLALAVVGALLLGVRLLRQAVDVQQVASPPPGRPGSGGTGVRQTD